MEERFSFSKRLDHTTSKELPSAHYPPLQRLIRGPQEDMQSHTNYGKIATVPCYKIPSMYKNVLQINRINGRKVDPKRDNNPSSRASEVDLSGEVAREDPERSTNTRKKERKKKIGARKNSYILSQNIWYIPERLTPHINAGFIRHSSSSNKTTKTKNNAQLYNRTTLLLPITRNQQEIPIRLEREISTQKSSNDIVHIRKTVFFRIPSAWETPSR